jgi:hypothetical protein
MKPSGQNLRSEGDIHIKGVRSQGGVVDDDVVCYIEHSLLCDSLGEDRSLVDVQVKSDILLEDVLISDKTCRDTLNLTSVYPSSVHGRDLTCGYSKRTRPDKW